MTWALVASASQSGPTSDGATSSAIDTTGATLIVVGASSDFNGTEVLTDSKSNTWTALTPRDVSGAQSTRARIYYCHNPTVGSGHTFTVSGTGTYPGLAVLAWSGAKATMPYDQESGATATSTTTVAPGSLTPAATGALSVAFMSCGAEQPSGVTINDSFIEAFSADAPAMKPFNMSYKIHTGAEAANPTFTVTTSTDLAAVMAVFLVEPSGAGPSHRRRTMMGVG